MSEELTKEAVDAAIILENRIRERVAEAVKYSVREVVQDEVGRLISQQKGALIMEITMSINQMLRGFIEQERKPLWETRPEDIGLTPEDLNTHMLGKEIDHAIRKQETSL